MVKVLDSGVQAQKFLSAFPSFESLLLSFLTPCGTVRLFDHVVAPGRGNHLLVVDVDQTGDLPDRGPVAPQLIGVNDLRDVVFTQESRQEGLCSFRVAVPLKENVEHEAVLVDRSPKPVADAVHGRTHLVQMPPGTPPGFPVAQFFCEEGSEFNAPLAEGLVADLNAALVEQFLDIPVTQGKSVVQPDGMLDDGHWKSVAVGLEVGHGGSAYPSPIKATQPL